MKKALRNSFAFLLTAFIYCTSAQTEVMFYTTMGDFTVELNDTLAPITAGNFQRLVEERFYDGITFHRVIDEFMIQGGDPTGTGDGGSDSIIQDEFHPELSNVRTTISMANDGPNTGSSQFFINLVNNTYLDYDKAPLEYKHPVFGKVVENFDVVELIGRMPTDGNDKPFQDIVMDSLRVMKPLVSIDEQASFAKFPIDIHSKVISKERIFSFTSLTSQEIEVNLFNEKGKKVYHFLGDVKEGENLLKLRGTLSRGVHFMDIRNKKSRQVSKVVLF